MKKLIAIFLLVFVGVISAQTTTMTLSNNDVSGGYGWKVTSESLDSAGTEWSNVLDFSMCDSYSWHTYPFFVSYDFATADSINISLYTYGSNDGTNYHVLDTIATVTSATAGNTSFNNNGKKFKLYKVKVVNNTASNANTINELSIYQGKRDIEN